MADMEFSQGPARIPERLERPMLEQLMPGTNWVVDADAVWVDENGLCRINKMVPLETEEERCGCCAKVNIVRVDEGYVLDLVSGDYEKPVYFDNDSIGELIDDEDFCLEDWLPLIKVVSTGTELDALKELLNDRYGTEIIITAGTESEEDESHQSGKLERIARILRTLRPKRKTPMQT